jgi:xanthine/CO dehydrogenase XdhC/CoxF family maturation factor
VTQVSADPADSSGPVKAADSGTGNSASGNGIASHTANGQALAAPARPVALPGPTEPTGPIERVMSAVIRKLSWSRVANPRIAMALAGAGLLLGMIVGATAPNSQTLPNIWLPLTNLVSRVLNPAHHAANYGLHDIFTAAVLYSGDILACLGLAGMLWAHSQGWRPDPRKLLLASTVVVAIMVCLTPVGSSDTASYAAYGRLASLGRDPYQANALTFLRLQDPVACHNHTTYFCVVGQLWQHQPSVYGPVATWIQSFAATLGGGSVQTTIWVLMILNGIAFLAVGLLLLKTSDDPIRATLFWTANAVLIQQLVGGGHFDTFVAAAAIAAIQLARRVRGLWADVAIGVLIGLGCGVKITAVLVAVGLAWPLLRRHEYARLARIALAAMATVSLEYSFYGLEALKPLFAGSQWVTLPSPWWFVQLIGLHLGGTKAGLALPISILWLASMLVVAWLVYQRISADQPREVVAPFALTYAWIVVAPWVFAWYTALPWVALTQVPRNRMTRWLAIVTVVLALWHSSGGWVPPGHV